MSVRVIRLRGDDREIIGLDNTKICDEIQREVNGFFEVSDVIVDGVVYQAFYLERRCGGPMVVLEQSILGHPSGHFLRLTGTVLLTQHDESTGELIDCEI